MKIHLAPNPVLVKELRGRMRGARAYIFLTAFLLLMGAVSYGLYRITFAIYAPDYSRVPNALIGPLIGQCVFMGLVVLALAIMLIIAPALTANAISSEVDRRTFDLLMATSLPPASIVLGKVFAALSYLALVLLAAVPFISLSFMFGGVVTRDAVKVLLVMLSIALLFSAIGVFWSAWLRRTMPAATVSYLTLFVLVFGTGAIYGYWVYDWFTAMSLTNGQTNLPLPSRWWLVLNPISALASTVGEPAFDSNGTMLRDIGLVLAFIGGRLDVDIPNRKFYLLTPMWRYTVCLYLWLSGFLCLLGGQLLKPIGRFRWWSRGWLNIALYLVVSVLLAPVIYWLLTSDPILINTP